MLKPVEGRRSKHVIQLLESSQIRSTMYKINRVTIACEFYQNHTASKPVISLSLKLFHSNIAGQFICVKFYSTFPSQTSSCPFYTVAGASTYHSNLHPLKLVAARTVS